VGAAQSGSGNYEGLAIARYNSDGSPDASFGQIVKERRSALGLTQAELANRVGCAPITIRRIEADNLRPSSQMAELLALSLKIPEAEQLGFVRLARQRKPDTPIPKPTPAPGEIAPDFALKDLDGKEVRLASLLAKGPVVVEFGSFT